MLVSCLTNTLPETLVAGAVVVALEAEGIAAGPIGEVVHMSEGVTLRRGGSTEQLAVFARDELAKCPD
jgi:hypothetical protein